MQARETGNGGAQDAAQEWPRSFLGFCFLLDHVSTKTKKDRMDFSTRSVAIPLALNQIVRANKKPATDSNVQRGGPRAKRENDSVCRAGRC